MLDRRMKNIEIFSQVTAMLREDEELAQCVAASLAGQKLYLVREFVPQADLRFDWTEVVVSREKSFNAARKYAQAGDRVCVLNFASSVSPGGGVARGSSAQEESLCRCSTLYPCLKVPYLWENFYVPHQKLNNRAHNDDCVYTPQVRVFMEDREFPELMERQDWFSVDVLTCAAPHLLGPVPSWYEDTMEQRIERIFAVAAHQGADVLILGAFGCGAFNNPPLTVAEIFKRVLQKYWGIFKAVEFAVYCRDYETENYDAFEQVMQKL